MKPSEAPKKPKKKRLMFNFQSNADVESAHKAAVYTLNPWMTDRRLLPKKPPGK